MSSGMRSAWPAKIAVNGTRVLLVANIQGDFSSLNTLAATHQASALIVTGDTGLYSAQSLDRIDDKTLRYWLGYSPLLAKHAGGIHLRDVARDGTSSIDILRDAVRANSQLLSEFQQLMAGQITLQVPVFIVPGVCEDVWLLEELRTGSLVIPNFHVLDEANTKLLDLGGQAKLRLFGLPGILTPSKLFDVGEARATIAGGSGKIWTTALQMGELVELAQQLQNSPAREPDEIRILLTYSSPAREPLLAQLAHVLKVDYTVSASMHLKYTTSYSQQAISPSYDAYRQKMLASKAAMSDIWDSVKNTVQALVSPHQKIQLQNFLAVMHRVPSVKEEEAGWKLCWNWSLCDVDYGLVRLEAQNQAIRAEIKDLQGHAFDNRLQRSKMENGTPLLTGTTSVPSRQTSASYDQNKAVSIPDTKRAEHNGAHPKSGDKNRRGDQGTPLHSPSQSQPNPSTLPTPKDPKDSQVSKDKKKGKKDHVHGKENKDGSVKDGLPSLANALSDDKQKEKTERIDGTPDLSSAASPDSKNKARGPQFGIFMSNLSLPITNDEIKTFLGPDLATTIVAIRVGRDYKTKAPKPTAIVQFNVQSSATAALAKSGQDFKGVTVDIQPFDAQRAHPHNHDSPREHPHPHPRHEHPRHEHHEEDRTSWGPSPHGAFRGGRGSHRGGFRQHLDRAKASPKIEASS